MITLYSQQHTFRKSDEFVMSDLMYLNMSRLMRLNLQEVARKEHVYVARVFVGASMKPGWAVKSLQLQHSLGWNLTVRRRHTHLSLLPLEGKTTQYKNTPFGFSPVLWSSSVFSISQLISKVLYWHEIHKMSSQHILHSDGNYWGEWKEKYMYILQDKWMPLRGAF